MSFAILTINFHRPQIIRLFGASIKRLRAETGIDFPVVCVSEPDDADVCREYGLTHIIHPNNPVSEKWNVACEYVRNTDALYTIVLGSDDIMSTATLSSLIEQMNKGIDFIGLNQVYVYDTDGDHRGELLSYRRSGIGVGRTISRRLLNAVNWKPWEYGVGRNWGMDAILYKNISPHIRSKAMIDGVIVDCKSHQNINKYTMFKSNYRGRVEPVSTFYDFLSQEEKDILASIKHSAIPKFQRVHKRGRTKI